MKGRILKDLLKDVDQYNLKSGKSEFVTSLELDSRKVTQGSLFVAVGGSLADGHEFINAAIGNGAEFILCEKLPDDVNDEIAYVVVPDARTAIGQIASAYYDAPSKKIKCVGVTGTNGKTTIATLLYNLFKDLDYNVGLISTIEILVNEKKCETALTTPDVISLHRILSEMIDAQCTYAFMEVSSHAADQKRIAGISFAGAVFSNITHDHLDYHGDFESYIKAKQSFFTNLSPDALAVINIDDKNSEIMVQNSKATVYRYSRRRLTNYKVKVLSEELIGMQLELNGTAFFTQLSGVYNASNLAAVYGVADLLLDVNESLLIEKISGLKSVKGRMELVSYEPKVIVDYAHTPDALESTIEAINAALKVGKLIVVVGCGGDRDKVKRPIMGRVALENSDQAIFTSDNPRSEEADAIIKDMTEGLSKELKSGLLEIEDRKAAIKVALTIAGKKDTVLIAGKGHEEYQEIKGVKHFFSDQQIVKDILSKDI